MASFPHAPLSALADILDRLAAPDVSDDHRKIFFDCTFRTLGAARNEGLVRAARRMLNRFFAFDCFIEDDYFGKILKVNQAFEREEARLKMESPFRVANSRVIAELAKKEDFLTSYSARLALLAHPHIPLAAGQKFIPLMRVEDLRKLAASRDISPEIAGHLRSRLPRMPK